MNQLTRIGRYEVKRVLGKGAAGVVYLARDPLIDREVAIKTLRSDLDEQIGKEYRQRFLREARAVGRLSHPAIVTIYDVGEDHEQDTAFIAMEYLEGITLKEVVASGMRYDPVRAARLGAVLAEALDHAHQKGVIHRDVKPANIILTADGKVKITDFGIARVDTSDLTTEGSFIGTPNYMSPEQVRGKPADERSDLYSLGVILFELVTGRRPFTGKNLPELSLNIATSPVPDPSVSCPDLPEGLRSTILRCLAKRAEDRFQSCGDLARSLSDIEGARTHHSRFNELPPVFPFNPNDQTPPPLLPDLVATRIGDAETIAEGSKVQRMLRRWSRAASPVVRTRWFWPLAVAAALLVALLTVVDFAPRVDEPQEPITSDSSSEAAGYDLAPVEAEPEPTAVPDQTQPTAVPDRPPSTLLVSHKNRMSLAYISLWVDGTKVWSQKMTAEKNVLKRFKRISGVQVHQSITVQEGTHVIEVHISGASMKVEARDSIEGIFRAGESRYLKVSLNPYTDKLKLEWTD